MKGCSTLQLRYGYTNKYLEIKDLSDTTLKLEHQLFEGKKKVIREDLCTRGPA